MSRGDRRDGWLPYDGRELAISEYPELFALLGFDWGGDREKGTFKLPGEPFPNDTYEPHPEFHIRMICKIKVASDEIGPAGMVTYRSP